MSEQDSKRATLSVKKRTVATPSARDEKPRLRAGARGRQVAQLKLAKDKVKRTVTPTPEAPASQTEQFAQTYTATPPKSRSPRSSGPKALPQVGRRPAPEEKIFIPQTEIFVPDANGVEIFQIFAPCPMGLEEALAAELSALGYDGVSATRAGCHFVADWWGVQRANLYSRLATRILVRVGQAPVQREDDILELARSVTWERWFGAEHTLRVDTSAVKSPMQSLQYCNLRAKDGICDRLRELEGERPSIDTVRPDARVHLFLSQDTATLYLDTSGESLFKRGWRLDKGDAPLRENLAAGILALSGWDPEAALLDPFCGSGTILIEAAWIALGVPPGITRPFGFERLRDHDSHGWEDVKDEARSRILPELETPLIGIDADPLAIEAAQRNAERAYLTEDTIRFEVGDARDAIAPAPTGWLVTNPPYGERLAEEDVAFWREWSANLKREFADWQVSIITSDLDLPKHLRLKANRRTPVFNGALDCRLFSFELVAASYRD
jgi:putative N6-adenine-specific DNA methylase